MICEIFPQKVGLEQFVEFPPSYAVKAVMIEHNTSYGVNKLGSAMYVLF